MLPSLVWAGVVLVLGVLAYRVAMRHAVASPILEAISRVAEKNAVALLETNEAVKLMAKTADEEIDELRKELTDRLAVVEQRTDPANIQVPQPAAVARRPGF